jgi:ATP-dependent helicase/nuclease subunit B
MTGRIDRVDTMETEDEVYVRIIDYKSGNKSFNLSDIYNGLELQLLIYLDAILEYASKNSKKPVIPGGILYFRIDDPIIRAEGELSEEEVEKEIMKSLRMRGLLLSDVKVVREMDRNMDGYSVIIPANIKMGSESFGPWSSVAGVEEFKALRSHVKDIIIKLCEEMLSGNISISPYKKKKETPCQFCSYKSVCRFDVTIKENSYRILGDKNKDEIWDAVKQAAITRGGEE